MKSVYVVVSYDIPDNRRRAKVCKTLKNFGQHVQYSVFECQLKTKDFQKLRARLQKLIRPEEDNLRFYFLCEACVERIKAIGAERVDPRSPFYVV